MAASRRFPPGFRDPLQEARAKCFLPASKVAFQTYLEGSRDGTRKRFDPDRYARLASYVMCKDEELSEMYPFMERNDHSEKGWARKALLVSNEFGKTMARMNPQLIYKVPNPAQGAMEHVEVVKEQDIYDTVIDYHLIGHPRARKCYGLIQDQHYGITRADVEACLQLCTECNKLVVALHIIRMLQLTL